MCRSHFHSRFKPALRASATAAALKAPVVRRHQVRLPLRTLRVLREGKPQLGSRSSGAPGRRQQGPRRPSDREATDLPHTDWTPTDPSHADRTGAREGARLPCDPPNGGSGRSVEEGGFREGRHHGDGRQGRRHRHPELNRHPALRNWRPNSRPGVGRSHGCRSLPDDKFDLTKQGLAKPRRQTR